MDERHVDVSSDGGVHLFARVVPGPDRTSPGLLLQHGLASSSRIWDLMLPRLARSFRVVAYDARGHGRSAKPSSGYGFDRTTEDAVSVIRCTRLRRPIIVGHSWGAMVALAVAAHRPRSVSGAVLVDGGVGNLSASMSWAEAKERLAPPHLAGMHVDEFRTMIRTFSGDAFEITSQIEDMILSLMRVDQQGRIHPRLSRANHFKILRAIWELDALSLWSELRVPVLAVLARTDDERAWSDAKARAAADVRRVADPALVAISWMDGIHDLPMHRPVLLAARVERFARGVVG